VERGRAALGVQQSGEPGHAGDPPVPQRPQVLDDRHHRSGVVGPHAGETSVVTGAADDDGRHPQPLHEVDPLVVHPQVDQEHAVDALLGRPPPVQLDLGGLVLDDLEHQRDRPGRQLGLQAGDQLEEERLDAERAGGPGEHQAHRVGTGRGQGSGGAVRPPLELVGHPEDAPPRLLRDARSAVERERDRAFRDTGAQGDVSDRRTFHTHQPVRK
jgi:hypothetical protein